jgi:type VI secretion system secreted protein VgrG
MHASTAHRHLLAAAALALFAATPALAAIDLGTSQSFAVLAGATVTNAHSAPNPVTQVYGDVGTSPGLSITDLLPGIHVTGGTLHTGDGSAQTAMADATNAYSALASMAFDTDLTGHVLGSPGFATLTPGVYRFDTSAQLTGTLVLDFLNNPTGSFVFQIGSTLTTASDSFVSVLNAAAGNSIYWQIGTSATLGTGTDFAGNVLAMSSITLAPSAQIICGRAIGLTGAVTLSDNLVSNDCGAQDFGLGLVDGGSLGFSGDGTVSPVPEPATAMLFLAGLAGLGFQRMKSSKRAD